MKHVGTRLATGLALVSLAGAMFAAPVLAQSNPGSKPTLSTTLSTTTTTTSASKRSETCSAVRRRLADAPQILSRIEANLDQLNAELDNARLPARRVALQDRIERLEALRSELAAKVADARRACGTV